MQHTFLPGLVLVAATAGPISACAAVEARAPQSNGADTTSVRDLCVRFAADRATILHYCDLEGAPARDERMQRVYADTLHELGALDYDALGVEERVDWILLHGRVASEQKRQETDRAHRAEFSALVPFANEIADLHTAMRRHEPIDAEKAAVTLESIRTHVEAARKDAEANKDSWKKTVARRAGKCIDELEGGLSTWYHFRADYDPTFTWWTKKPYEALVHALEDHAHYVQETLASDPKDVDNQGPIVGDAIGRDALVLELQSALIPYTPEELEQIADREMQWCTERMLESSRALGCGDDWKKALERVKLDHVAPGEQPALITELAHQAIAFLKAHDLVTVPPLAEETWRMSMLSADEQRVSPFFLGGEEIQVAFPTDAMTHDEKMMSMRGNNRHFAHATVFHELIPGHGLQQYYEARYATHRAQFSTPFWTEGWALYWEMLMWDQGFHTTPEDRIGALFWRMHRCARIHFSLGFHLGTMTPEQCVDYLVETVGHERKNAEAEVRRSFTGGYGPLYQCAYMIGGLQLRALHKDLVDSGKISNREFHDAVLSGNNIPIEMVRARLMHTRLPKDFTASWRFYDLSR